MPESGQRGDRMPLQPKGLAARCCQPIVAGPRPESNFVGAIHAPIPVAPIRRHASENFFWRSGNGHSNAVERAISSKSQSCGTTACCCRKISRSRRFARFRWMAPPTAAVEAITQTRAPFGAAGRFVGFGSAAGAVGEPASRRFHQIVKARQSTRSPFSRTARISLGRRRCCSARKRIARQRLNAQSAERPKRTSGQRPCVSVIQPFSRQPS